ncbi:Plasmodium yoelii subtelomeric region (PYST-C1), putative [Plasmodium chabaudi adami]|uniref:Plasmodium yoelii subtelomeric region (PYST-C1), putative n=1 Tax=Plasmodium chabaudi adami TaxID=5826 RepID=A0A1D3LAA8_PLACE|nr:Plasmodium yoelii subtelomeric region (PYST-C1), putative [Plasmodium chabaudi adami]
MNKQIFSLYHIHDRSKEYGLRSRIIRAIKQIKRSSKKNDIESKRETQSNNNNNYDYERYRGPYEDDVPLKNFNCFCFRCP